MLKQRSIRNTLIIALTLLSATVLCLASSSFWGLYRYRQLATAVSQRAMEIRYAYDLNRLALTLRESNARGTMLRPDLGMIHSSPLGDPLLNLADLERARFNNALTSFSMQLQLYQDKLGAAPPQQSLLIDDAQQRNSLVALRQSLDEIECCYQQSKARDQSEQIKLANQLESLVEQTDQHLQLIHHGVTTFSKKVRGQYQAWIGLAWSCTIAALLMMGMLLAMFRALIVKPFTILLDGCRLVVDGQFGHQIDLGTGDELSELAEAMNGMTKRFQGKVAELNQVNQDLDRQVQQRTREVIQNEQLASVGFLAAGVAHEINNPLATIAWSAESLAARIRELAAVPSPQRICSDPLCDELNLNLKRIEDEAYRCKGITERLLDFSRLSEVRRASTDLVELVRDVVEMVKQVGKYKCKTIRTHGADSVIAEVNPQEIRQVVLNLVTNALESVETDGAVDITIAQSDSVAEILVRDDGCGMTPEVLNHLFEPFFTRRRDGTGSGLGLSITYRIVSQHGGSLVAHSDGEGRGSQLRIRLPLAVSPPVTGISRTESYPYESSQAA